MKLSVNRYNYIFKLPFIKFTNVKFKNIKLIVAKAIVSTAKIMCIYNFVIN